MSSPVPQWSESRYWQYIRNTLRSGMFRYPNKYKVREAAKRHVKIKKGNQKWEYRCNSCRRWFPAKSTQVDHINPAGSLRNYDDLASFVRGLYCTVEEMQLLCKRCHKKKTIIERGGNPKIVTFKKKNAKQQRARLKSLKLPDGTNAKKRIEIYTKYVESKSER